MDDLEIRLLKLEHRVKTFSIASDGAGIDWPVYKFKPMDNESDKPHATQLTELEHQWKNCQLLGDGTSVKTSGNMHDGWAVNEEVTETQSEPTPPVTPGNIQITFASVVLDCGCSTSHETIDLIVNATYELAYDAAASGVFGGIFWSAEIPAFVQKSNVCAGGSDTVMSDALIAVHKDTGNVWRIGVKADAIYSDFIFVGSVTDAGTVPASPVPNSIIACDESVDIWYTDAPANFGLYFGIANQYAKGHGGTATIVEV